MLITYLDLMHAADAPLWLRHSPAALGEIKVHWSFSVFFFLFLWVGWWRGGCHHFHQQRGCLSAGRSRRLDEEVGERCHNGDERIESQQLISFTSPFVWPFGRGRGAGTTCKDDAERNIISRRWGGGGHQPPFLPVFTKSGHITEPEKHTLDFLSRQEKGQSSNGGVKMSLSIQANLAADGGWARPGEGKPNGCGLRAAAVASVQRTGKSEEQTHEGHSPS